MLQRIATKAVIVKDDKILILREAATYGDGTQRGRYHMPGGRVEIGEPFEDALRREIREETGLEVTIGLPIYVGEWHPVIKGVPNQIIAIFFNVRHHNNVLNLFTSLVDLALAAWVILLAFRLIRAGGGRVVTKQRARQRKHTIK